jgi:hypothetical protein
MKPALIGCLVGGVLTLAASALAQPETRIARAVLFDQPNFQGRSITIAQGSADLTAQGFAGMAMSGHFDGPWTICADPAFRGHCETVSGDMTDLSQVGLSRRVDSLRQGADQDAASDGGGQDSYYDRPPPAPRADPEDGRAFANQGVAGHTVVFFYRPQRAGADIPGQGHDLADAFCRDQGLGPALYYATDGVILRDVLCQRD